MQEQDIPIDINTGKLLDWLINRRHCKKDWHTNILTIREKINNAIQDMPVHDKIAELLTGAYINYFHCLKIVEILKETEANTKNLFGRYGSQRMKDWQEILRLYETDNVYIAEAAQILTRNVNYEVPNIKKQIHKLEQTIIDLEKKEAEHKKSELIAQTEHHTLCKQLDITGQQIKEELMEKVTELPQIYRRIAENTKNLNTVIEFYSKFVEFTNGRQYDSCCIPVVKYIIEKGNTTTYEYIYGELPTSVIEPPLRIEVKDDKRPHADMDIIDFSTLDIDVNDSDEDENLNTGVSIDWGDESTEMQIEQELNVDMSTESGIVVEATDRETNVARGEEAYSILDNPTTRYNFVNELFELQAFLKLRLYEFKSSNKKNILSLTQMQDVPSVIQLCTMENTQNMLDNVQVVLSEILDNKVQQLHDIKHYPRYVDIVCNTLNQKLNLVDRMIARQKSVRQKQEETQIKVNELHPLLKLIVQKTKELQIEIEQDISKKYKNRIVHLTGGVNTL